jgi:protease-4
MFASMLGTIITLFLAFLILMGIIVSAISSTKEEVKISDNSILHIKFEGIVNDRSSNNPFEGFDFNNMKNKTELGLNDILKTLKKAKDDPKIKGIFLDLSDIQFGVATLEEIRNELKEFKKSGKFIYSYSETYSQKAYYLATVSDVIALNKEGSIDFHGLGAELMFFKGLLKKLDVEMKIIRHGKYKSAIEPFMLDKMSNENREQTRQFLSGIWEHIVGEISQARKISVDQLQNIADSLLIQTPEDALKYGFIDKIAYKDEVINDLKTKSGIDDKKDLELVTLLKYKEADPAKKEIKFTKNKIAVVYAVGSITGGEGNDAVIGSEKISKAIREARIDSTVKAIVLRVNSPGGDALASEVIWREVVLAKNTKPVVVSMGDYAASGGYYIACGATKIVASPSTITGSIGVFGMIPNMQKLFNNKLGITFDTVMTNKNAITVSGTRPLSTYQEKVIQNQIERIYKTFITHVAEGRKMSVEAVDNIGQGRVWNGYDAKKIGLIDEFGGLDKAVEIAKTLAKVDEYKIIEYPKQKEFFQQILDELKGEEAKTKLIKSELGDNYIFYKTVQNINTMKGLQARIPYLINIY